MKRMREMGIVEANVSKESVQANVHGDIRASSKSSDREESHEVVALQATGIKITSGSQVDIERKPWRGGKGCTIQKSNP